MSRAPKTEESTDHPPEADRETFEERVYGAYFISQVRRTGRGGPIEFVAAPGTKEKAELLRRDPDAPFTYADEQISAMWFGWCLAAKHAKFSVSALPRN